MMDINSASSKFYRIKSSIEVFDRRKEVGYRLIPTLTNILYLERTDKEGNTTSRTVLGFEDLEKLASKDEEVRGDE